MHYRGTPTTHRDRTHAGEERGLTNVTFVGSFPEPDFDLTPELPEIAFVGRSNVGKSSLINAVLGRQRLARTSQSPGKTRLCNVFDVKGQYYLVDLPGYGYARVSKSERRRFLRLITGYLQERRTLRGALWLLDIRRTPSEDDRAIAATFEKRAVPILAVVTKADKVVRGRQAARVADILETVGLEQEQVIVTSARTNDGIPELRTAIEQFVAEAP